MDGGGKPSHRRSLQHFPRSGAGQQDPKALKPGRNRKTVLALNRKPLPLPPLHIKGTNCSPIHMDPDVNPQDEKQHRKSITRRSSQVPRDEFEGPPASIKPLCPAKPSPSFLELPSTQWKPSPGLPYTQTAKTGKGKRHFSPEHQPQECFGLLECMHNNIQVQTKIAQAQLSLLEDMRETMNVLLSRQEQQSHHESARQSEQRPPKTSASSPHPLS